jgi:hypothetical protein
VFRHSAIYVRADSNIERPEIAYYNKTRILCRLRDAALLGDGRDCQQCRVPMGVEVHDYG